MSSHHQEAWQMGERNRRQAIREVVATRSS